jgi:uncharacterized membrane protein YeiB
VHQFEVKRRFAFAVPNKLRLVLALLAYAFLAFMAWRTMQPDKIRLVTFAILGLMAFRTVTHGIRMHRESEAEKAAGEEQLRDSKIIEPIADSQAPTATKSRE